MRVLYSLIIAFSTYSRIPMPQVAWSDENRRYVMCFFPLVGAAVGVCMALWLWLSSALALGPLLRCAVGAVIPLLVTGGIHMDGLMDTSDALSSWQTRERRLEILKDTHTGAFAVMACAGYLLLSAAALSELTIASALPLLAVFVFSRALCAAFMTVLPSARTGGMLDGFAQAAERRMVRLSCGVYALLCLAAWLAAGWLTALLCACAAALLALWYRGMCTKYFGGITGDLAGWLIQMTELWLMMALVLGGKLL